MNKEDIQVDAWKELVLLRISCFELLAITANLGLALRHPENNGPTSQTIRKIGAKFAHFIYAKFGDQMPTEVIQDWLDSGFLDAEAIAEYNHFGADN